MVGFDLANVCSSERHYGEFKCYLCDHLASLDSYITKGCSHVFCKECCHSIDSFITKCPRCRMKIQGLGDLQILEEYNPLACRILRAVRVACPHQHDKDQACEWVGSYSALQEHIESTHSGSGESSRSKQDSMTRKNDNRGRSSVEKWDRQARSPRRTSTEQKAVPNAHSPRRTSTEHQVAPAAGSSMRRKSDMIKKPPRGLMEAPLSRSWDNLQAKVTPPRRRSRNDSWNDLQAKVTRSSRNNNPSSPPDANTQFEKVNRRHHDGHHQKPQSRSKMPPPKIPKKKSSLTKSKNGKNNLQRKSSLSTSGHSQNSIGTNNPQRKSSLALSGHSTSTIPGLPSRRTSLVATMSKSEDEEEPLSQETKYAITCAESHYYNREYENCISLCNDALASDDKTSMAYQHKGRSQIELGLFDDAVETFTIAAEKIPKSDKIQQYLTHATQLKLTMKRVTILEASKDYAEVIKVTDRALGSNKHVLLARARAFVHLNDHEGAVREATAVISIDTQNLDALLVRSRAYYLDGDLDQALIDCQTAVNIDQFNGASVGMYRLLQSVADSFKKISDLMEAKEYGKAIEEFSALNETVKPTLPDCKCELFQRICRGKARARLKEGNDYNKALSYLNQVLETAPRDQDAWMMKIACLEKLDLYRDLANELNEIIITWGSGIPELVEAHSRALNHIGLSKQAPEELEEDKPKNKSKDKTKESKAMEKILKKNPFKRKKNIGPVMTPDMAASPELLGDILSSTQE